MTTPPSGDQVPPPAVTANTSFAVRQEVGDERETVHRIIYDELCVGVISEASRSEYRRVMAGLASQGARAIILGCTEISLLVNQQDSRVPLFDTTAIHARAAAEEALVP